MLKLIERKWNLPPLTARDAGADDLLDMVDFGSPPAFAVPPKLPSPKGSRRGKVAADPNHGWRDIEVCRHTHLGVWP